jgi:CheY-like chemotaxis protein
MESATILLVEDEKYKREHISRLVLDAFVCQVATANSVKAAFDAIENTAPLLILLDMSLPTYDIADRERGGRPQGYGGREVLRFLELEQIQVPIIIITGYDAFPDSRGAIGLDTLKKELFEEFSSNLKAVLRYDSTSSTWRDELLRKIEELKVVDKK